MFVLLEGRHDQLGKIHQDPAPIWRVLAGVAVLLFGILLAACMGFDCVQLLLGR